MRLRLVVPFVLCFAACFGSSFDIPTVQLSAENPAARSDGQAASRAARPGAPSEVSPASAPVRRLREGAAFTETIGAFRAAGERYWFQKTDDGREMRVLENLALERVAKAIGELGESRAWSVTGVVTEYQNENYLLIQSAVLKSRKEPAKPAAATP